MNTNQDVYRVGETATIEIGVLDDAGLPTCGISPKLIMQNEE